MTGLYPGTTYYFAVTVTDDASNTSVWNYGAFNTKSTAPACDLKPDIVSAVNSTPADGQLTVSWTEPSAFDIDHYIVEVSSFGTYPVGDFSSIIFSSNVSAGYSTYPSTSPLINFNTYYYRITTYDWGDDAANGLFSTVFSSAYAYVSAFPYITPPAIPGSWAGAGLSSTTIKWTWADVDGETGYRIKYATNTSSIRKELAADVLEWTETNLTINTSYYRVIVSSNSAGESALSSAATTWTLANPSTGTYFSGVFQSSVTITWAINSNPGYTNYGLSYSTKNDFSSNVSTPVAFASGLTANTTAVTGLSGNTSYYFRVWAYNGDEVMTAFDTAITTLTATAAVAGAGSVVINEIAWMGTDTNANDEWIELYNNTAGAIDLTGWYIMDDDVTKYDLAGSIASGSYYLIEDQELATDVVADIVIGIGLVNGPPADSLKLYDNTDTLIDSVDCSAVAWFAGSNTVPKKTMERIDPTVSGNSAANWANNDTITKNGLDSGAVVINGTPRSANSVYSAPDTTDPGQVTDLAAATGTNSGEVDLTWTAPGDDGTLNNLSGGHYLIAMATYSVAAYTENVTSWWQSANIIIRSTGATAAVGKPETATITGLTAGTTYYFSIEAYDSSGNDSVYGAKSTSSVTQAKAYASTAAPAPPPPGWSPNTSSLLYDRNYSFENDFSSWTKDGTAGSILIENTVVHSGAKSCKFVTLASAYSYRGIVSSTPSVMAGNYYLASAWAYVEQIAGAISEAQFQINVRWYDNTGALLPTDASGNITLAAFNTWEQISFGATAPAGAVRVAVEIEAKESVDNNNHAYVDDVELVYDNVAPGAITNLSALTGSGNGEVDLTWTAPGSDGTTGSNTGGFYIIGWSVDFVVDGDTATWWTNTSNQGYIDLQMVAEDPGETVSATIGSLTAGVTYYFAIVTYDSSFNVSETDTLSLSSTTQAHATAFKAPSDPIPPADIDDLTALTGSVIGTVNLVWTAPGDDGAGGGTADGYLVKYSQNQITSANFDSANIYTYTQSWTPIVPGSVEGLSGSRVVSGLAPGTTWYFAIKAKDNGVPGDPIWGGWNESDYADNKNRAYSKGYNNLLRIANAGFELSPALVGWNSASTSITQSDSYKKFGTYSCKFNDPTTAYSGRELNSSAASATGGSTYTVGGYFYLDNNGGSVGNTQILIHVSWRDNAGVFLSSSTSSEITLSAFGAWELKYMDVIAPSNAASAVFSIQVKESVGNNNDLYADGIAAFVDTVPPAAITDLSAAAGSNPGEIILSWTAPGDDGTLYDNITGASYEVIFATVPVTTGAAEWWLLSTVYDQMPEYWTVSPVGATQQKTLNLRPGVTYWFALKTIDASGNMSAIDENCAGQIASGTQAFARAKEGFVGSLVRINEVAPSESSDNDWIEFYNSSSTVNIKTWKVYINNSLFKTFPDFTFQSRTYIVLHFNSSLADEDDVSGDINGNGYRDFYADVGGIPSGPTSPADIMITLRNPFAAETIIDAVCVADKEGSTNEWVGDLVGYPGKSEYAFKLSPAKNGRLEYNTAVLSGQWFGVEADGKNDSAVEDYCVSWKFGIKGYSIARDGNSTDGTNPSRNEWSIAEAQTQGSANFLTAAIDVTAPGQIADLFVTPGPYRGSLRIIFSNVGDDGLAGGEVSSYDARYSEYPIVTESDFKAATLITYASKENAKDRMRLEFDKESTADIFWIPGSTSTQQDHIIGEFKPGEKYYIAVRAEDEQGNKGPLSTGGQTGAVATDITGSPVVINEISPINAEGKDWIEFYNASGGTVNLSGWIVYLHYLKSSGQDYFKPIKIIPTTYYFLPPDSYVVMNFGSSGTDETPPADTNGNGYYDLYLDYAQFNDAEGAVILADSDRNVVDAVLYSDRAVSLSPESWDDTYVECYWAHQWSPISEPANHPSALSYIANTNMVDWSQGAVGYSLARDENSYDSDNTGNAIDDWRFSRPTKGIRNDSTSPAAVADLNAVNLGSPFDKDEEGNVLLTWTAPGDDGTIGNIIDGLFRIRYSSVTSVWASMEYEYYASTSIAPGTLCSHKLMGLYPGELYYFLLKTEDEAGNPSAESNLETLTVIDVVPDAPVAADIAWIRTSSTTATIFWLAGPLDIDYYNVSRRVGDIGAFVALGSTTSLSWTSNDLTEGTTYYYRVWAVDKAANTSADYCQITVLNYAIPVIVSPVPFPREICMIGNDMSFSFELNAAQSVDTLEVEYFRTGVARATAILTNSDFTVGWTATPKSADVTIPVSFIGSSNFYYQIKYEGSGRKFETENIQVSVSRSSSTEWDQGSTFALPDGNDLDGAVSIYMGAVDGTTPSGLKITQTVIPLAAAASYSFPKGLDDERVDVSINGGMPVICWDIDAKDASGYDMDVAFANPVSITLLYLDLNNDGAVDLENGTLAGVAEARLKAYFLDERNHVWRFIGGDMDTSANTLTFKFPHLSRFALFATKADGIKPVQRFLTARIPGGINFDEAVRVKIYDPRGREVVTLTTSAPATSPIVWYGADRETSAAVPASQMVESGAYIYESFGAGGAKATGVIIVVK